MFYDCMYVLFLCTVRRVFCVVYMADNYYFYVVETVKAFSSIALADVINSRQ